MGEGCTFSVDFVFSVQQEVVYRSHPFPAEAMLAKAAVDPRVVGVDGIKLTRCC